MQCHSRRYRGFSLFSRSVQKTKKPNVKKGISGLGKIPISFSDKKTHPHRLFFSRERKKRDRLDLPQTVYGHNSRTFGRFSRNFRKDMCKRGGVLDLNSSRAR